MEKIDGVDCISPPCVGDEEEYIGFAAVYPRGFQSVPFEPAALLHKDELKEKVQSCVRLGWSSPQEIYDKVVGSAKPKNNMKQIVAGLLFSTVSELNSIQTDSGECAIQVIASGTYDYRAHVDVGTTVEADECIQDKKSTDTIRKIRQKLIDKFISSSCPDCAQSINMWPQICTASSWLRTNKSSHFLPSLFCIS